MRNLLLFSIICMISFSIYAQDEDENQKENEQKEVKKQERKSIIDTLTYQTASGLPIAASKIYFSDSKFTVSGFFESNYTNYRGSKNTSSRDLELYQTNLQRFVSYMAYKPKKWLILYGEIFLEFANDGSNEYDVEYLPEFFVDFLLDEKFNVRVGTHQPQIGFINNNDEPVMFYSVNRPEVERLIIPSQWIDLGVMTYGNINENWKWSLSAYQGLDVNSLNGATWIRGGREDVLRFNLSNYLINSSIKYNNNRGLEVGLNGVYTRMDLGEVDGFSNTSNTILGSTYVRKEWDNFTLMALGSYGKMSNTDGIFAATANENGIGEVLGSDVYGYYVEAGYDILPILGLNKTRHEKKDGIIFKSHEMKLPLFVRYERLDTHANSNANINSFLVSQSDLEAVTVGLNFNPRRSIVLKANYQFRNNNVLMPDGFREGNRFELGLGFIF